MFDNTARVTVEPESDRPTLIPGAPLSLRLQDTSELDRGWPEEAVPRHSLIAERGIYGRSQSGTFPTQAAAGVSTAHAIEYDVYEDARVLLVLLDVPGVDPAELSIHLSSVALHVSASTPEDPKRQSPVPAGKHEVVIEIPRGIEPDSVDASLRNGLLRLRITKPASAVHHVDIVCQ
jgi:HSP20 family molecular chaperone IbpA